MHTVPLAAALGSLSKLNAGSARSCGRGCRRRRRRRRWSLVVVVVVVLTFQEILHGYLPIWEAAVNYLVLHLLGTQQAGISQALITPDDKETLQALALEGPEALGGLAAQAEPTWTGAAA